jgi:hypothetical protein
VGVYFAVFNSPVGRLYVDQSPFEPLGGDIAADVEFCAAI